MSKAKRTIEGVIKESARPIFAYVCATVYDDLYKGTSLHIFKVKVPISYLEAKTAKTTEEWEGRNFYKLWDTIKQKYPNEAEHVRDISGGTFYVGVDSIRLFYGDGRPVDDSSIEFNRGLADEALDEPVS